ncbi:MAG: hypothetical protein ACRDSR_12485 [Pseudonocardiaceae bacterium]
MSDLAVACERADLEAATVAEPVGTTVAETVQQAITRTLAIGLVAARSTGKYDWTTLVDLDQLVTDAARIIWPISVTARSITPSADLPPVVARQQDDRATSGQELT